jgi:hypothetical protein
MEEHVVGYRTALLTSSTECPYSDEKACNLLCPMKKECPVNLEKKVNVDFDEVGYFEVD